MFEIGVPRDGGGACSIRKDDPPRLVEHQRTVALVVHHQLREALRRIAGTVQLRGLRVPACLDAGAHQPQLDTIAFERGSASCFGLHLHRLVHEPEDARRRQQRQQDEQDDERSVAIATVGSGSEHLLVGSC